MEEYVCGDEEEGGFEWERERELGFGKKQGKEKWGLGGLWHSKGTAWVRNVSLSLRCDLSVSHHHEIFFFFFFSPFRMNDADSICLMFMCLAGISSNISLFHFDVFRIFFVSLLLITSLPLFHFLPFLNLNLHLLTTILLIMICKMKNIWCISNCIHHLL